MALFVFCSLVYGFPTGPLLEAITARTSQYPGFELFDAVFIAAANASSSVSRWLMPT